MLRLTSFAAAALIGSAALAFAQQPNASTAYPNGYANQDRNATSTMSDHGFFGLRRHRAAASRETSTPTREMSTREMSTRETPTRETMTRETMNTDQFSSEGDARARCGSETIVWVNTKTHVYHLPGSREFGQTKHGAFMCQADADRSGKFRAAKNEMRAQGTGTSQIPASRFSGSSLNRR
ncbi:MAG: hypothetical protein JO058_11030 [Alphaproteobacteria bacterium]|nr:hypothetical protein [Alphaproteobacteria bacterium]MBV9964408.1 hypothetical protein [Alphaproteobacteria bacterium]